MTKLVICAVRDSALQTYMQPFQSPTSGGAVRAFADEVKRPESPMGKHPEDYELWLIGEFDDATGAVSSCPHESLMTASRALEI